MIGRSKYFKRVTVDLDQISDYTRTDWAGVKGIDIITQGKKTIFVPWDIEDYFQLVETLYSLKIKNNKHNKLAHTQDSTDAYNRLKRRRTIENRNEHRNKKVKPLFKNKFLNLVAGLVTVSMFLFIIITPVYSFIHAFDGHYIPSENHGLGFYIVHSVFIVFAALVVRAAWRTTNHVHTILRVPWTIAISILISWLTYITIYYGLPSTYTKNFGKSHIEKQEVTYSEHERSKCKYQIQSDLIEKTFTEKFCVYEKVYLSKDNVLYLHGRQSTFGFYIRRAYTRAELEKIIEKNKQKRKHQARDK
ncbi:hypothetical protein L4C34_14975 [Vibrio profundum]|uniref:DUF2231 domain-containing protein n=1 Tax=Vibrio profundum TaxID=2910247 RepID=UPI003D0D648A